jgi:hypothetical protein
MPVVFTAQLQRQLGFMETSARAYDAGHRDEAIRLGTSLRVLFHQTSKSTSLLRYLGAESIAILSTSDRNPVSPGLCLNVANNLITDVFTGEMRAAPWLAAAPTKTLVPFVDWWKNEVIFFNTGIEVTRRDLALWAANQDGGAHVDDALDVDYEKVTHGLDVEFFITHPDGKKIFTRASELHLAALRQFAYEVLESTDIRKLAGRK